MTRRHGIASIGLSAAIAALVLWHPVPRDRPAPPPEPARSEAPPPAEVPTPPVALATVTLPPPPPSPVSPSPASVETEPAPTPPRAVEPLKPQAPTEAASPAEAPPAARPVVAPLKPAIEAPSKSVEIAPRPVEPPTVAPLAIEPLRADPVAPSPPVQAREEQTRVERPVPPREPVVTETAPTEAPIGAGDAAPVIAAGRPLLRLLEHGDGPDIDIAWPAATADREALFRAFEQCYGMLVALIASDGRLFSDLAEEAPWRINLDRYSGFVRHSGGLATPGEGDWSRRIVRRHPQSAGASIVRVFPRAMDALLMGGLRQLIGPSYRETRTIRARYRREGSDVFITDIVADGTPVAGRIALRAAAERRCRAAATIGRSAT